MKMLRVIAFSGGVVGSGCALQSRAAALDDVVFGTDSGVVYIRNGTTLAGVTSDSYGGGTISAMTVLGNQNIAFTHAQASPAILRVRDSDLNSVAADTFGSGPFKAIGHQSNDNLVTVQYDASLPSPTTLRIRKVTPPDTTGLVADQGLFGDVPAIGFALLPNDNIAMGDPDHPDGRLWVRSGVDLNGVAFDTFGGGPLKAVAVQHDGDIVFAQQLGSTITLRIRRVNGATTDHVAADQGAFGNITGMGVLSNDDVVITNDAGQIYVRSGVDLSGVAFDSFGGGGITAMAIQSDDDIFLAQHDANTTTLRLRRIVGDTTTGLADDTGAFGIVTAAAVEVPEPTSISAMVGGAAVLLRRRSRS